jgi:hypothetical protein
VVSTIVGLGFAAYSLLIAVVAVVAIWHPEPAIREQAYKVLVALVRGKHHV